MSERMIKALVWTFLVTSGLAAACHLVELGGLVLYALGVLH